MRKHCAVFERVLIRGIPKDWSLLKTTYGDSSAALAFIRTDGVRVVVLISCDKVLTGNAHKKSFFRKIYDVFRTIFKISPTSGRK